MMRKRKPRASKKKARKTGKKKTATRKKSNPAKRATKKIGQIEAVVVGKIYDEIVSIEAKKRAGSGTTYFHDFKPGSEILGLSDGSILIRSKKGARLFKDF